MTSKTFINVINKHFFKYDFNNKNNVSAGVKKTYNDQIKNCINNYWMSLTKPLAYLQGEQINFADAFNLYEYHTRQMEEANPKSSRFRLVKRENNAESIPIFIPNYKFKKSINMLHCLYHEEVMSYLLINEISESFLSEIIARCLSLRAHDGYIGKSFQGHFVFPNIFAFICAQIIFYLNDTLLILEKKLRDNVLESAFISTDITADELELSYKVNNEYAIHIPRFLIYEACLSIDYKYFYNSLQSNDKRKLNNMLYSVQSYIDTCRSCEKIRSRPVNGIFKNQNFVSKRDFRFMLK